MSGVCQSIVWSDTEGLHEARVEEPIKRQLLTRDQVVIEHCSASYAIYVDIRDGSFVARPVTV